MASHEHKELANFVKTTHKNLRIEAKNCGADQAWKKHCENKEVLQKYAGAMRMLATKYWEDPDNKEEALAKSRIHWVYAFCDIYYFKKEILRQREREQEIAKKINVDVKIEKGYGCKNIVKLLDVGSCYNPFKAFDCFDVVAVDIAPANDDVYRCDFLNLSVVDDCDLNITERKNISVLPKCTFDVVVFSLLLEYLPCPKQRLLCCINAYNLLRYEGLLIIITPDSKHVGANAKFMKSWRYNLAKIGFSRIKYEKLPHIHCMAFRKSIRSEVAERWAMIQSGQEFFNQMLIPQDLNSLELHHESMSEQVPVDVENRMLLLNELPSFPD